MNLHQKIRHRIAKIITPKRFINLTIVLSWLMVIVFIGGVIILLLLDEINFTEISWKSKKNVSLIKSFMFFLLSIYILYNYYKDKNK